MSQTRGTTATVAGCGWMGLALAARWVQEGLEVAGTTTRDEKMPELTRHGICGHKIGPDDSWQALPIESSLLVITVPPGRRHPERVRVYPERIESLASRAGDEARVIFLSSTGVYGQANGTVDEESAISPTTDSARAVADAEKRLVDLLGPRLTILRLAGLIGPDRHPGRWFAGKTDVPNGDAPVNLVHQIDVLNVIDAAAQIATPIDVLNVCAVEHPRKSEYYPTMTRAFGLTPPTFQAGGEDSKRVSSDRLRKKLNIEPTLDHTLT